MRVVHLISYILLSCNKHVLVFEGKYFTVTKFLLIQSVTTDLTVLYFG